MKISFIAALVGLLLASSIQAAASSTKHAQFLRQAHTSPDKILDVKGTQDFDDLIASPRNYSVSLLLTAVDSGVQCGPCTAFQPTYQNLARSYAGLKKEAMFRHLFANLEFKNGREVFQKLKLQYAPVLLFFPATAGPFASSSGTAVTFDFNRLGFEGADVAAELSKQLGITVPYNRPFQWKLFATAATSTMVLSTTLYLLIPRLLATKSFSFGLVWNVLIQMAFLATIVIMCAGQMWNSIRNAPYLQMNAAGKPEYFAGGFQNQYGAETHIVALVCESTRAALLGKDKADRLTTSTLLTVADAILAFSVISLTILVPMQRDPVKQRAGVYVWSAILLGAFSLLIYIFRIKNPSYPFRLFF